VPTDPLSLHVTRTLATKDVATRACPWVVIQQNRGLSSFSSYRLLQMILQHEDPLTSRNRAITGGTPAEDGAADLPLNYMTGYGETGGNMSSCAAPSDWRS
jgi:hypothetical protein